MSLLKVPGFALDSTSNFTFANATVTSNLISGNANLGNVAIANYFVGNGSLLTGLPASYSNTNVAAYLPTYSGNISAGNLLTNNLLYANGVAWNLSGTYSNSNVASYLPTFSGNLTSGNANLGNSTTANYFVGNGSLLTSLTGTNVTGQVSNALIAGTVYTNSQPNITSVGTLTSLSVSGNATITGNLIVSGSLEYINSNAVYLQDPIIELGGAANGAALSTNDSMDRGSLLHYYTTTTVDAFMGWKNSASEFVFASNASVSNNVATINSYGNIHVGNANLGNLATSNYFIGNGYLISGITGANVTGTVSLANNASYLGGTAAGSYLLTTGTGSLLTAPNGANVTGTVASANNSSYLGGTAAASYLLATGTGSLLTAPNGANVTGTVASANNSSYLGGTAAASYLLITGSGSQLTAPNGANVTGTVANSNYSLYAGTVITAAQPNITSVGTLTSLAVTGNITSGNANLGNLVLANYYSGNGYLLSGITGANVTGQVGNSLIAGTVYTNAQPNITSVGTLTSLTVTGNVSTGNVIGTYVTGTLTTAAQPNVTSVGTLSSLSVTGNISASYFVGNFAGNISGNLVVPGSNTDILFNNSGNAGASDSLKFNSASNVLTVSGNIVVGNISGANAVSSNYFIGNGSLLTGLPASYSNSNVASYLLGGANLGSNVSNVYIGGGTSNQVLKTDGAGNLSWTTISSGTGVYVDTFTGNGVQTNFTISSTPANANLTLVNYNGALQLHGAYTLTGNVIALSEAPASGSTIEVITLPIGGGGIGGGSSVAVGKTIALNMFLGF